MRLLVAIAHHFNPRGGGGYGSLAADPRPRITALTASVVALHQSFGPSQYMFNFQRWCAEEANRGQDNRLDVVICTTRGLHVLDRLPVPSTAYRHHETDAEPPLLGFECQAVLRDALGKYEYYCYIEDDLVIRDPLFFSKLAWFTQDVADDSALLQPNRYERDAQDGGRKAYIDGHIDPRGTAAFQDVEETPVRAAGFLSGEVVFRRALNPHSGCYFLNEAQMDHWAGQPHFLDREAAFVGPLESAATLGIMRTFKVYKPDRECASFLEIEHANQGSGRGYLGIVMRGSPEDRPPYPLDPAARRVPQRAVVRPATIKVRPRRKRRR